MKVNFNTLSMPEYGISYSRAYAPSIYNVNAGNDVFVRECKKPAAIVSFGSAAGTERTVLWLGAEISDIKTKGGVATVMHDYLDFPGTKNIMGIPYHNGYITYDYITGEIVDVGSIIKDNQPVYTNENLKTVSIDNLKDNQFFKLEEIASKEMMWSEEKVPIKLYQIFDKNGKAAPIYSVYTERLALMNEAYADSSYSSGIEIKKIKGEQPRAFRGTAYGQFNKAALELLPELALKQGIKFDHIVASDDQCGFLSEYLQQFREYGAYEGFYNKITSSHIGHNIGKGYVNGMSLRDMLVNLGLTIEDAKILRECPQYQAAVLAGPEEEGKWLAENIFSGLECAPSSATEVALLSTKYGTSQRFDVVSELYAKAVAQNPRIAELPIHKLFKELYVTGIAGGILNPLNDPSVAPDKPIKFPGFSKPLEILADGTAKFAEGDITGKTIVEAFETYNFKPDATPEEAFEQMKSIKYKNKRRLLDRYSLNEKGEFKYSASEVIAGLPGRKFKLTGGIDMDKFRNLGPEELRVYSMWGRGDFQKGHDIALEAWAQFAKTDEGKNAFLVIGGDLSGDKEEAARIKDILKRFSEDPDLKGRFVFTDGFAPGYAYASGSDIAIFPSRFAPCELTDLEAIKYYCIPMVPNVQGMAQKNFDPRSEKEAAKAISYKTRHEYYIAQQELDYIRDAAFDNKKKNLVLKLGERYGIKEERFTNFWDKYKKAYKEADAEMKLRNVSSSVVEELTIKLLEENEDYKLAERALQDGIVTDEMVQAMKYDAANRPGALIFENHRKLQTAWETNGALHPSGKASAQLYREGHTHRSCIRTGESIYKTYIHGKIQNWKQKKVPTEIVKTEKGKGALISGIIVGAAGIGTGIYYYLKSKKKAEDIKKNFEPALISQTSDKIV